MIHTPEHALTNEAFAVSFLQEILSLNVTEFCICPGARNASLVSLLEKYHDVAKYYWFEERSAAFFALGKARLLGRPVAIITTSGTAVAEVLPAMMEAYYTGVPLLAITADRPRHLRGTAAPQTAEQVGIFGRYAVYEEDLEAGENSHIAMWDTTGPAHVNLCFEEPSSMLNYDFTPALLKTKKFSPPPYKTIPLSVLEFFKRTRFPFVIVSSLWEKERPFVKDFLLEFQAPTYFEAPSCLREDDELAHLAIRNAKSFLSESKSHNYPIDAVLRIGGVPTCRFWRDLENLQEELDVYSLSKDPFSGLSWGACFSFPLENTFQELQAIVMPAPHDRAKGWIESSKFYEERLELLFKKSPTAEQSLFRDLSRLIPEDSLVYLGNSSPVREWDLCALLQAKKHEIKASRGLNGIDGQISTFLGLCTSERQNWCIVGDLTALYDLAAPWILKQLPHNDIIIVVVNNGGGQIFSRMFSEKAFLNEHTISFKAVADLWGINYARWDYIPTTPLEGHWLIELIPDNLATHSFWDSL